MQMLRLCLWLRQVATSKVVLFLLQEPLGSLTQVSLWCGWHHSHHKGGREATGAPFRRADGQENTFEMLLALRSSECRMPMPGSLYRITTKSCRIKCLQNTRGIMFELKNNVTSAQLLQHVPSFHVKILLGLNSE